MMSYTYVLQMTSDRTLAGRPKPAERTRFCTEHQCDVTRYACREVHELELGTVNLEFGTELGVWHRLVSTP